MSQAAALYVTASAYAESSDTYGAKNYYQGVRDAFEVILRSLHDIPPETGPDVYAIGLLADMDDEARKLLLRATSSALKARRRESLPIKQAVI